MNPHQKHRKSLLAVCILAAAVTPLFPSARTAFAIDWLGATSTDWNTAANWNPAAVPNSTTASVNFNDGTVGTINISSSVAVQSINFNNLVGSYILTSSPNQTLAVQNITLAAGVTGTEDISLNNNTAGNLLFPSGASLILTNNAPAGTLDFDFNTIIGTSGGGAVVFNGPGTIIFAGSFVASGNNFVEGGFVKNGPGLVDYAGSGIDLQGGITLNGGTLNLNYSFNNPQSKLSATSGALTLKGGILQVTANATTTVTQSIPGGTAITAGQTDIVPLGTGTVTLNLGTTSRANGATMDVTPLNAVGGLTFTANLSGLAVVNGLLGNGFAFMTANGGTTWATSTNNSTISGLTAYGFNVYNNLTVNTDVTVSSSTLATIQVNTLRFNTGFLTLALTSGGTATIQSGGILETPSASGALITGGTLLSGNNELIFQIYSPGGMTVASALSASAGLTKAGPGLLTLSGINTSLGGPININRGGLDIQNIAALGSTTQINFNDLRIGNALQTFTVDLGNSVNATVTQPIQIAAFSNTAAGAYATVFSTAFNTNSIITLSGVLSSSPGQTTPILFAPNSSTSGFNLTNANTFTGNIDVTGGSLGINSDASLGNIANALNLGAAGSPAQGLVLLNSKINVAHAINFLNFAGITSNGTDTNTISGLISGAAWEKLGTGLLTLSNPSNTFGDVLLNAGTLAVSTDGNLGISGSQIVFNGGTLENTASFTLNAAHNLFINNSGATFNTDPFTTLTVTQNIIGGSPLVKTGAGTLALTSPTTFSFASVTVSAGTLALAGATFNGGSFTNNSVVTGFAAFTAPSGTFTNNGLIILSGGPLFISTPGANSNAGTITLAGPTMGLQLAGSGLTNSGTITLAGAIIAGSATLLNAAGGTITGPGIISVPFANNLGAQILNAGPGALILTNSITNSGIIQLAATTASLSGAAITNPGTITGFGSINNPIINSAGTIEPTGGTLILTGQLTNNATIRTAAGTKILIQGASIFSTNAGLISLVGGTFDTGGQPLDNTGQITGYGTLSTGGLTNDSTLTFTGGTTTVNGNVTNNANRTINIQYQPAVFTGNINNLGTINVTGTTITYTGTYTGNKYVSDPATNIFQNNVTILPTGSMTGQSGDKFLFTGGTVANNGTFNNAGLLVSNVNFTNAASFTQSGPQTWSPSTTFTNTAGTANFLTDPGSSTSSTLALIINAGTVLLTGPQHLAAINLNGGTLGGYATLSAPLTLGNSPHTIAPSATLPATSTGNLTLSNLTTNANTTLAFNLLTPGANSINDSITLPTANSLTLNGGTVQITGNSTGLASLGYYKVIQYAGAIQGAGISSITLPPVTNNIAYTLDTSHDPGYIDVHRGFLGDANDDGTVNFSDFVALSNHFGTSNAGWSGGDFNGDGIVNFSDFVILSNHFGQSVTGSDLTASEIAEFQSATADFAAPTSVPEPATLPLLALAATLLAKRKKPPIQ